jgi:formate hydrogenlyase subunit 6/NADH:ubiquinone oxidoreductase subunit I
MAKKPGPHQSSSLLKVEALSQFITVLKQRGYEVFAPVVRDAAIIFDPIDSADELPAGWTARQEAAAYRLEQREDKALFGYAVGMQSAKRFLHPPEIRLFTVEKTQGAFQIHHNGSTQGKRALIGLRPCDVAAMAIQDRVLMADRYADPIYEERRRNLFVVVVECGDPASTCFCTSMGAGPAAMSGYDIALTEVVEGDNHFFIARAGSEAGEEVLKKTGVEKAPAEAVQKAHAVTEAAASKISKKLELDGLKELLYANPEHPRWDKTAKRCLACGNCTMACPTCFCVNFEETSDLAGEKAERWRRWDSCFNLNFTYIHGGTVRTSLKSRYRHWMTHKLASWQDQFGTCGCVGCGRCITWCPAGIDITEEAAAIRAGAAIA